MSFLSPNQQCPSTEWKSTTGLAHTSYSYSVFVFVPPYRRLCYRVVHYLPRQHVCISVDHTSYIKNQPPTHAVASEQFSYCGGEDLPSLFPSPSFPSFPPLFHFPALSCPYPLPSPPQPFPQNPARGSGECCKLPQRVRVEPGRQTHSGAF